MTTPPTPTADASAKPPHSIPQPKLRELTADERIVRCAGLKFILPNVWRPGDVLDEESAAFINTAWHTALLNRFGPQRETVLTGASPTYEKLDQALQAHAASYNWTPRPASAPTDRELLTDEDKDLIAFARPMFNTRFGGKGFERKDYEAELMKFVEANKPMLRQALGDERTAMSRLTSALDLVLK